MQLFFAGAEAWSDLLLSMGVKYQLYTYFYFREMLMGRRRARGEQLLSRMRKAHAKGYRFFLDSGAFTFQSKNGKAALPPPDAYFKEYLGFLRHNADLFDIIAEFDVDGLNVGTAEEYRAIEIDQIDDWTDDLIKVVGYRAMPTYHENRGLWWLHKTLLDVRTPILGFSSDTVEGAGIVIAKAHRFGKWVHGFGQTGVNTSLKTTNFDSVDSTTWLRADKYGGTNIFKNGKWIVLDHLHKHQRALHKDFYESWGLDMKLIMAEDLHELRKANIVAWRELANDFEARSMIRGKGQAPYLLQMHKAGNVPKEHPMVTKMRNEGKL